MQEEYQADARQLGDQVGGLKHNRKPTGPPKATLERRAQSYSDFHDTVKAVLSPANGRKTESAQKWSQSLKEDKGTKPKETEIQSELDFTGWYNELERGLLDSSHDEYAAYQTQLELSHSHLDSLLSETTSTLSLLASLTRSFKEVEAQTTTFQKQCEGLLDEQKRIEGLADDLDQNLKYYNSLEPVTRRLNAPGAGNFVRSKEFSEMLARLDECLRYMAAHVSQMLVCRK